MAEQTTEAAEQSSDAAEDNNSAVASCHGFR